LHGGDEWVSGYVGTVLADLDDASCRQAARTAWDRLLQRRGAADGWGHNENLPVDADSTQWGARLAAAVGAPGDERALAARRVLRGHLLANGGVATYARSAEAALQELMRSTQIEGMFGAHTCVTAATAHRAALGQRAIPYLIEAQESDGRWRGYWWSDDEYTTWLAADALLHSEEPGAQDCVDQARQWAADRFDRNHVVWSRGLAAPSPFATALCVTIVAAASPTDVLAAEPLCGAVQWLLETQKTDGSWQASALMRMPPGSVTDGDERPEATAVSADDHRLFTTATVLRALAMACPEHR